MINFRAAVTGDFQLAGQPDRAYMSHRKLITEEEVEEGLGLFFIFAFMLIFGALILQKYGFCDEYGNFIALDPADFDNRTSTGMDISDRQDLSTASHAIGESSGSSGVHHSSQAARQQLQMQQLSDQKESKIGQVVNNKGGFEINRSKAPTSQTSGSKGGYSPASNPFSASSKEAGSFSPNNPAASSLSAKPRVLAGEPKDRSNSTISTSANAAPRKPNPFSKNNGDTA